MTRSDLRAAGAALYGERWQSPLARALGVNLRTLQRWTAGTSPVPDGIASRIAALARSRIAALQRLVA